MSKELADYAELIGRMPVREHAFWARRSNWESLILGGGTASNALRKLFDSEGERDWLQISRGDLRDYAEGEDLGVFLMATHIWGYPRTMRGGYTKSICAQLDWLIEFMAPLRDGDIEDWKEHYSSAKSVHGLGLSTYSKFLAFFPVRICGYESLILDDVVATVAGGDGFTELHPLHGLTYESAPAKYVDYLACMTEVARRLTDVCGRAVQPEQVEMFLFTFGRNLKSGCS